MRVSRRFAAAWICAVALGCSLVPAAAFAAARPSVSAPAALVMMMDGRVMWSRRLATERRVASTIKMLNALVVREHVSLDEVVTVSRKAAATPDGVGLVQGQRFTVGQLLRFMLVASANDAAEALAIHIGGTESRYVAMMNGKARELGLTQTHAVDPHGLSKREHSTAHDLSVIARELMKDPALRAAVITRSVKVRRPNGKYATVASTNKLLGHYAGIEGVKTGFTNPAGYCLVSAAKRGRFELVGVVLGTDSLSARFTQTRALLDWGFAHVRWRRLVSAGQVCASAAITSGTVPAVTLCAAREASGSVIVGGSGVTTSAIIPRVIRAPVRAGQQLGVLRIAQRGVVLAHIALVASSDVATLAGSPDLLSQATDPGTAAVAAEPAARAGLLGRVWAVIASGSRWVVPAAPTLTLGAASLL